MKKALIGQSYFLRFDAKLWDAMQPYPPLGSLYAAAYLKSQGFEIDFFDAMLSESTEDWRKALERSWPAAAVLYEDNFNYLSKMCLFRMREAAFEMIRMAKLFDCPVIVAGSDATDDSLLYVKAGADYVLIGEGELTLHELLQAIFSEKSEEQIAEIPGLVTRTNPSKRIPRRPVDKLDSLPFPAWELVDLRRYRDIWVRRHGYFSINMATTRGCPYHCNWCAKPIWGQRYHSRSPENVVEEMVQLKATANPDHIWFVDDIFGLKKNWIERFAELVEEYSVRTPFKCLLRTDLVTARTATALARAGCRSVWLGAESGSQKVLDAMEKGASVQDTYAATAHLRSVGIRVSYFLQFGYPGEDWEDIRATLQMVWNNMPDDIGMSVSYPLPGTPFYQRVQEELGDKKKWFDSNDMALLFPGRFVPAFYRQLHRVLHKEYRARKAWDRLRRGRLPHSSSLVRAVSLPWDHFKLHRLRRMAPGVEPADGRQEMGGS